MFFIAALVFAFTATAVTAPPTIDIQLAPGNSPLDITASVTNAGDRDISILKLAPLLSNIPVNHFRVFNAKGWKMCTAIVLCLFAHCY
jgi:deuterolysin